MHKLFIRIVPAALVLMLLQACNLQVGGAAPTAVPTEVPSSTPTLVGDGVMTFTPTTVPGSGDTSTPTLVPGVDTFTPTTVPSAVDSSTPTLVPGAGAPGSVVLKDTLCWAGPGSPYDVVSAVHKGAQVTLLGRGSIDGWYVIQNPIYHDPCWMPTADLQPPSGLDITGLKVFAVPATPVPSKVATAVPTSGGKP